MGFADPETGISYGYVTSRMGTALTADPRDVALRHALYSASRKHREASSATLRQRNAHEPSVR